LITPGTIPTVNFPPSVKTFWGKYLQEGMEPVIVSME